MAGSGMTMELWTPTLESVKDEFRATGIAASWSTHPPESSRNRRNQRWSLGSPNSSTKD